MRSAAEVIFVRYSMEELEDAVMAELRRPDAPEAESPDELRRALIEVLDRYPRDMGADDDATEYRLGLEEELLNDETFGGASPEHLHRSRPHLIESVVRGLALWGSALALTLGACTLLE